MAEKKNWRFLGFCFVHRDANKNKSEVKKLVRVPAIKTTVTNEEFSIAHQSHKGSTKQNKTHRRTSVTLNGVFWIWRAVAISNFKPIGPICLKPPTKHVSLIIIDDVSFSLCLRIIKFCLSLLY